MGFLGLHTWEWSGLDRLSTQKNADFDPLHSSVAPTGQKLDSGGVAVGGRSGTQGTCLQRHIRHLGMMWMDSAPQKKHFDILKIFADQLTSIKFR